MAHIFILRQAISFVEGENLHYGTHEIVERNINKRKYEYNGVRKGYNIPTGSEWKLIDYRIKKECIPQFLEELRIKNLNPKTLPKGFWFGLFLSTKFCKKLKLIPNHWYFGKLNLILMLIFKLIPFLHGVDVDIRKAPLENKIEPLAETYWCNNFFLGYVNDIETIYGEEL